MFEYRAAIDDTNIHDIPIIDPRNENKANQDIDVINHQMRNVDLNNNSNNKNNTRNDNILRLPRQLNRSRRRDPYMVLGAVKCREPYVSRNLNQEASMETNELFIIVGNQSGPWLPVVAYDLIRDRTPAELEAGLDIQKRYCPEDYVDRIDYEIY